jgi:hypothetical protein
MLMSMGREARRRNTRERTAGFYKYTRFVESFRGGEVWFQPLSFYQRHEANSSIGDPDEAARVFRPTAGLKVNNLTTGERFLLDAAFVSAALAESIYVLCLSRTLNRPLARDFESDSCIEITGMEAFTKRIEQAVAADDPSNLLFHGRVDYYDDPNPPKVSWTSPRSIVMSKRACYTRQDEYRFAFGRSEVFDHGRTVQSLALGKTPRSQDRPVGPPRVLKIGDIRSITTLHPWDAIPE